MHAAGPLVGAGSRDLARPPVRVPERRALGCAGSGERLQSVFSGLVRASALGGGALSLAAWSDSGSNQTVVPAEQLMAINIAHDQSFRWIIQRGFMINGGGPADLANQILQNSTGAYDPCTRHALPLQRTRHPSTTRRRGGRRHLARRPHGRRVGPPGAPPLSAHRQCAVARPVTPPPPAAAAAAAAAPRAGNVRARPRGRAPPGRRGGVCGLSPARPSRARRWAGGRHRPARPRGV